MESPPTSDEELMQRVQKGDRLAYNELFQRHHHRVYGYLLRRERDRELADDLFQETFLSVYRARHTWKPGRAFRPWLFAIAANVSRDHARRTLRRPQTTTPDRTPAGEPKTDIGALQPVQPQSDARLQLESAIAQMPSSLRDAFLLGVVEGFDHREVAEQLDISPANARARISRGRAWLRRYLSGADEGAP